MLQWKNFTITFPLAAGCLFCIVVSLAGCSRQQRYPAPPIEGANVVIPAASLSHGMPQFYTYRVKGTDVHFFVLRIHDRVLSFLDACLTCYPRKLGYSYREGHVVCRACNTSYPLMKLEKGIGGCYPIRIEGTVQQDHYLIACSALERRVGKF